MQINPNAPLVAEHSILIEAPRVVVWNLLTDIANWPHWHAAITAAQLNGQLAPASEFQWTSGGMAIVSTIQILEPEQRFGWTGKALGTTTEHIWTLTETPNGTLVTTAESMSGWLIYPVKLITPRFLTDALQAWLTALQQAATTQPALVGAIQH